MMGYAHLNYGEQNAMKTYDASAGTHGSRPFLKTVKDAIQRLFDRERELVSLRNVVGMMSEARRADAYEYHQMADALREARAKIHILEAHLARHEQGA
jgi:hypothetical protein